MRDRPVVVGWSGPHATAMRLAMHEAVAGRTFVQVMHCCTQDDADRGRQVLDLARPDATLPGPRTPPVGFALATAGVVDTLERAARTARLLVLGGDDATWFTRLHAGDVVARLARHADSPVVVVPRRAAGLSTERGRVVMSSARGDVGPATVRFAFEQARRRGAEVVLAPRVVAGPAGDALATLMAEFADVAVDVRDHADRVVAAGDMVVVERPRDASVPFASSVDPEETATVEAAVDRGCPVAVVPA